MTVEQSILDLVSGFPSFLIATASGSHSAGPAVTIDGDESTEWYSSRGGIHQI
jgi:hypothetical protein